MMGDKDGKTCHGDETASVKPGAQTVPFSAIDPNNHTRAVRTANRSEAELRVQRGSRKAKMMDSNIRTSVSSAANSSEAELRVQRGSRKAATMNSNIRASVSSAANSSEAELRVQRGSRKATERKKKDYLQIAEATEPDAGLFKPDEEQPQEEVTAVAIDEEAYEKEIIAKTEKEVELNIMSRTVQAVEVKNIDGEEGNDENGKRKASIFTCCIPLILVALILGLVLGLRGGDENKLFGVNDLSGISDEEYLLNLLAPTAKDTDTILDKGYSPQAMAFDWILNEDPAALAIQDTPPNVLVERYSLAVLYFSTGGQTWTINDGWMTNVTVCLWSAIQCSDEGSVAEIDLGFNRLNGTVPSELASLASLLTLKLGRNSLHGMLPSSLGSIPRLEILHLDSNMLSGKVPNSYGDLKWLRSFSVGYNSLIGTIPDRITTGMFLIEFDVYNNMLTGTIPEFRPFTKLELVQFGENKLTGTVPVSLFLQNHLTYLGLGSTELTGTIHSEIGNLENLVFLHAESNRFHGHIPTEIGKLSELKELWFQYNQLSGSLPSEIGNLQKVGNIILHDNALTGLLPSSLANLQVLNYLAIQKNNFTGNIDFVACKAVETEADCGGATKEVECQCCTACCNDGGEGGCDYNVSAACEISVDRLGSAGESRGTTCTCHDEAVLVDEYFPCYIDYLTGEETCAEAFGTCTDICSACNPDNTICAQAVSYGHYVLGQNNRYAEYFATMQYSKGRNDNVSYSVYYEASARCEVYLNGQECDVCRFVPRPSGDFFTNEIDCRNVDGVSYWNGNEDGISDNDGGALQVFSHEFSRSGCRPPLEVCYWYDQSCVGE